MYFLSESEKACKPNIATASSNQECQRASQSNESSSHFVSCESARRASELHDT
jgi:hypothetical protein